MLCQASCRIPLNDSENYRLLIYSDSVLALIFGHSIFSKSLESIIFNESILSRQIRGAQISPLISSTFHSKLRIHSSCFTSETVLSCRCDCALQLKESISNLSIGDGVLIYLHQEGRGIGLLEKLKAYNLQDLGYDTVTANTYLNHPIDSRSYLQAVQVLNDLGITSVDLMTNNPDKIDALSKAGILVNRIEIAPRHWSDKSIKSFKEMDSYLITKREKMGHVLTLPEHLLDVGVSGMENNKVIQ